MLWLFVATVILVGAYISLPLVASKTLNAISSVDDAAQTLSNSKDIPQQLKDKIFRVQCFAGITLILGLSMVSFACYLLGKSAFVEMEIACRYNGLADALCLVDKEFAQFEKAAAILVPKARHLTGSEMFSAKDLKVLADVIKTVR